MTNRAGFVSGGLLAVLLSLSLAAECAAQSQKGLKSNSGEGWISRRHLDDGNKNEDIAAVLVIKKKTGQDNDNVVTANIFLYDDLNAAGDKYKLRKKYENLTGVIQHVGGPKRGRETCELTLAGANGIRVWVTLHRNKINNAGNAPRIHQRVLMRYKEGSFTATAAAPKAQSGGDGCQPAPAAQVASEDDCEEEPNEDVLEEEEIVEDGANVPIIAYDP